MGSDGGDGLAGPTHLVQITAGLWITANEVTNAQYQRF